MKRYSTKKYHDCARVRVMELEGLFNFNWCFAFISVCKFFLVNPAYLIERLSIPMETNDNVYVRACPLSSLGRSVRLLSERAL